MSARTELLVMGVERVALRPGAVIGRARTADLCINDPALSEAHALVSLRGSSLRLLSLRGRFAVNRKVVGDVELVPGLSVELAPGITLEVLEVRLPEEVLGLELDGGINLVPPPVCSFVPGRAEPVTGLRDDAEAVLWVADGAMHLRRAGAPDVQLVAGDTFSVGERTHRVLAMPLSRSAIEETGALGFDTPLHLVVRFDTVHIWRGQEVALVDGIPARMVSELALIAAPVEWQVVAREIWPEEDDGRRLRMNWDAGLARLRTRLREAGVRPDLVRGAGGGRVELFLGPSDRVTDLT